MSPRARIVAALMLGAAAAALAFALAGDNPGVQRHPAPPSPPERN